MNHYLQKGEAAKFLGQAVSQAEEPVTIKVRIGVSTWRTMPCGMAQTKLRGKAAYIRVAADAPVIEVNPIG